MGANPGGYGGDAVNTSGQGAGAVVPPEIKGKWNWGAFLITPIWGIGNQVWIALLGFLGFIPYIGFFIGLGIAIYCGIKGNELAWQKKQWTSVQQFQEVQKKWAIAGVIVFVVLVVLSFMLGAMMKL